MLNEEYIPEEIIKEFEKRWEETPKCTFEEFYKEAFSEENRRNGNSKWYSSPEDVLDRYNDYIEGKIGYRYIGVVGKTPREVYMEVLEDTIITFKK
jgi:hypothetical protein